MKEITKNQATTIWQIFFVLWLTVGSIVCFNIHCITSEPPIYAPMFAITPLYLIEFYFDHPYTVQAILFQNFVLILMPALLWFLTYKSVFKNKKSANTIILILMISSGKCLAVSENVCTFALAFEKYITAYFLQ